MSETFALLLAWTPWLAEGFLWNILVSAAAMAIGTPAGLALARLRLSEGRLRHAGTGLTAFARMAPTFVLLFYLAYVLPPEIAVGTATLPLPPWLKASLALSIAVAGFVSDNGVAAIRHWRDGLRAEALLFVPSWTIYFIIIVMASSTASVIGVPEIVQRANIVVAATGTTDSLAAVYLYAMAWFFAFSAPVAYLMHRIRRTMRLRIDAASAPAIEAAAEAAVEADLAPLAPDPAAERRP